MPAAAVIPAPIGYIKVVAVEKLVVVLLVGRSFNAELSKGSLAWDRLPFCGSMWAEFGLLRILLAPLRH